MTQNNQNTQARPFPASQGVALFGFSIIALTQPIAIWIPILGLVFSVIVGITDLFPRLRDKLPRWLRSCISQLIVLAWFIGFIFGWLNGANAVPESWKNPILYIGFFWLFVITAILAGIAFLLSEQHKRQFLFRWLLRLFIPIALLWAGIDTFLKGDNISGGIIFGLMILTFLTSNGILKIDARLPALFD